jgi:hypothetical protein
MHAPKILCHKAPDKTLTTKHKPHQKHHGGGGEGPPWCPQLTVPLLAGKTHEGAG